MLLFINRNAKRMYLVGFQVPYFTPLSVLVRSVGVFGQSLKYLLCTVRLFACLSVCLSLYIRRSVDQSIDRSVCLSFCHLSVFCLFLSSFCPSVYLSVCLSVCLSVSVCNLSVVCLSVVCLLTVPSSIIIKKQMIQYVLNV